MFKLILQRNCDSGDNIDTTYTLLSSFSLDTSSFLIHTASTSVSRWTHVSQHETCVLFNVLVTANCILYFVYSIF